MRAATCRPKLRAGSNVSASARSRLLEDAPQTRTDAYLRWLDKEVVPGRVVSVGKGNRRLVFVTERRGDGLAGVRDNGKRVTLALERIGRVWEETHALSESARDAAFELVQANRATPLREPGLRAARSSTEEAVALINDLIESLAGGEGSRTRCEEALWSVMQEAESIERLGRRLEAVHGEAWHPFERRARALHHFGDLDFFAERVTERGRWLADLRLDRPLLVGEAISRGLFASLDAPRAAGLMAALAADAERDYGELEMDDALITALAKFDLSPTTWRASSGSKTLSPRPRSTSRPPPRPRAGPQEWTGPRSSAARAPKRATSSACSRARASRCFKYQT